MQVVSNLVLLALLLLVLFTPLESALWAVAAHVTGDGMTPSVTSSVVSLSGGALFANIVSVIILIIETVMMRR